MRRKDSTAPGSFALDLLRVAHVLLMCHAAAIVGITYAGSDLAVERLFAILVAAPVFLSSFFCCIAITTGKMFSLGVFFCSFLMLTLAVLPARAEIFFPFHLLLFLLAFFYGLSALVLARQSFLAPLPVKK